MTFLLRFDSVSQAISTQDRISFEGKQFDIKSVNEIGFREGVEIVGIAHDEG